MRRVLERKNLCVHALMAAGPAGLEPVLIVQHR